MSFGEDILRFKKEAEARKKRVVFVQRPNNGSSSKGACLNFGNSDSKEAFGIAIPIGNGNSMVVL